MPLNIGRLSVDEAGRRVDVREALGAVGCPEGQEWRVEIVDEPDGCQLIVDGPRRLRPAEPEWQQGTLPTGDTRYRRRLCSTEECTPRAIRNAVRRLVWENIDFRENAVWAEDGDVADALEQVAWELLSGHELPPLQVRLGTWRGDPGVRRFVCKVEAKTLGEGGVPPWRWWSPILGSVDELGAWLQSVLEDRGVRAARRSSGAVGRPAARAAAPVASV